MMDAETRAVSMSPDEIALGELFGALRQRWRAVVVSIGLAVVLATIYLQLAAYRYAVTLQVTPATGGQSDSVVPPQLGGLAQLAGISLAPTPNAVPFELYLEGLRSREAADALAADETLMRRLFAEEWDDHAKRWSEPSAISTIAARVMTYAFGIPPRPWRPPDGASLQDLLKRELRVAREKDSAVVTIEFRTSDVELGADLLWTLHTHVDDMLRQRTLGRTNEYIAYLRDQLEVIDIVDYRRALLNTVAEQEKLRMMASSTLPFAAEPFGRPVASRSFVEPQLPFVFGLAVVLGAAAGGIFAVMRYWAEREAMVR